MTMIHSISDGQNQVTPYIFLLVQEAVPLYMSQQGRKYDYSFSFMLTLSQPGIATGLTNGVSLGRGYLLSNQCQTGEVMQKLHSSPLIKHFEFSFKKS